MAAGCQQGVSTRRRRRAPPTDQGWAWMVLWAGSLLGATSIAMNTSFGLIFGDFLKQRGVKEVTLSSIGNTCFAVLSVGVFLSGPLSKIFSKRRMAIFSAFMMTLGLSVTSLVWNVYQFVASYCLLFNLFSGLSYGLSFLVVNDYFDKRRGLAMSIFNAGSAVGRMALPTASALLFSSYGPAGAVLILGAVWAHSIPAALVFQPLDWPGHHVVKKKKKRSSRQDLSCHVGKTRGSVDEPDVNSGSGDEGRARRDEDDDEDDFVETVDVDTTTTTEADDEETVFDADGMNGGVGGGPDEENGKSAQVFAKRSSYGSTFCGDASFKIRVEDGEQENGSEKSKNLPDIIPPDDVKKVILERKPLPIGDDTEDPNSSQSVSHRPTEPEAAAAAVPVTGGGGGGGVRGHLEALKTGLGRVVSLPRDVCRNVDFRLLGRPMVALVVASECFLWTGLNNFFYVVALDLANRGFTMTEVGTVLSIVPAADLASRLTLPLTVDRQWTEPKHGYVAGFVLASVGSALFPIFESKWGIFGSSALLGFGMGSAVSHFALVAVRYCGIENLHSLRSFTGLMPALCFLASGPVIGNLATWMGSYAVCFFLIAGLTGVPPLLWLIIEPRSR